MQMGHSDYSLEDQHIQTYTQDLRVTNRPGLPVTFPSLSPESPRSWGIPHSRDSALASTFTFLATVIVLLAVLLRPPASLLSHLLRVSNYCLS